MATAKSTSCSRLVTVPVNDPITGRKKHRVDVCGEPAGHGERHRGRYKGIVWEQSDRKSPPNIISHGGSTVGVDRD